MFQAGDLLVYGTTGVCRVLSIDRRQERVASSPNRSCSACLR